MSPLEMIAVVLGLANIVLIVRRSVWNYPFGIAMVALYARIFFDAKLYSDALLQIFFLVVNLYGWRVWLTARDAQDGGVAIRTLGMRARVGWAAGTLAAALAWGTAMARFTDAALPWIDAGVAATSVAAQLLMARRYVENWWLWIAVDIVSLYLYTARGLYLTTGLYALFLVMAVWGLIAWRRADGAQRTLDPAGAGAAGVAVAGSPAAGAAAGAGTR